MKLLTNNIAIWFIGTYAMLMIGNAVDMWSLEWFIILITPFGVFVLGLIIGFVIIWIVGKITLYNQNKASKKIKPTYNRGTKHNPEP